MNKQPRTFTIITFITLLSACAFLQQGAVSFNSLTPKQKATWAMNVYNAEFADHQLKSSFPDLTESEKTVLREKKKILTELYSIIKLYDAVAGQGVGDKDLEQAMLTYITQIERLIVRRIE